MHQDDLAAFLRRRRSELTPAAVGLPTGQRRRTRGLRREEVAHLVGMSVNYYTRLEQARGPRPSAPMLAAIARGLRLTHHERDYLFRTAGHPAPERAEALTHVAPGMRHLLDQLEHTPAMIVSEIGETLVSNRLATLLLGDHTANTGLARFEAYRWFTDPSARALFPADDHAEHSRLIVAALRMSVPTASARSRARDLIDALLAESSEFAALWTKHDVGPCSGERKTIIHPDVGPIEFEMQFLFSEDRSHTLRVLTTAPGSAADQRLQLLGMLGANA